MSQEVEVLTREEQDQFQEEQMQQAMKRRELLGPDALDKLRARQQQHVTNLPQFNGGNFSPSALRDAMDFGTMMATADMAIPPHLRANPGACVAITLQALAWGFEPFFVANKSYAVKQRKSGDVRLAYESQLLHAVIERRAPLERRLEPVWIGEGPDLMCHVHGHVIGEPKPLIWEGLRWGDVKIKNSPEWHNNPKKQLWYHSSRDWARIYFPDVLGGAYTRDELEGVALGPNAPPAENVLTRLRVLPQEDYDTQGAVQALDQARTTQAGPAAAGTTTPATTGTAPGASVKPGKQPSKPKEAKSPDPKPPALQEPASAKEYMAWAETWIGNIETGEQADVAELRWEHERDMRTKFRVSVKERTRLQQLLEAQCAKARGGDDAKT